jgi:hypothetical protein
MDGVTPALCRIAAGTALLFSLTDVGRAGTSTMPAQPQTAVRILLVVRHTARYPCARAEWKRTETSAFGPRCPITPRLRRWLRAHPSGPSGPGTRPPTVLGDYDPICRCQNDVRTVRFHTDSDSGGVARVTATIAFYPEAQRITFVVLHAPDGWRVDDTYCAGRPQTSIYQLRGSSGSRMLRCP